MPESGAKLVDYCKTRCIAFHHRRHDRHPSARGSYRRLPDVIRAFAVKTLYSPVDEFEGKPFEAMKRGRREETSESPAAGGQRFSLGRAEVEFYAPLGIYDDVNDLSLVTRDHLWADGVPVHRRRGKAVRKRHDRQRRGAVRNGAQGRPSRQQHVELLSLSAAGHAVPTRSLAAAGITPMAIRIRRCWHG